MSCIVHILKISEVLSYFLFSMFNSYVWISYETKVSLIMNNLRKFKHSLIQYKGHNSKFKFFDGLQFRKYFISLPAFYLIIWLMKSPNNFEKTSIFKIWQLVFFRGVKTQFGEIPLKSYIFRYDKNYFSPISPHNIYFSD